MKFHSLVITFLLTTNLFAQKDVEGDSSEINKLTYYNPIFIHKNKNANKYTYAKFEEIATITIDSIFSKYKNKYKVSEKQNLKLSNNQNIQNDLRQLFKHGKKKINLNSLNSLQKELRKCNNRFVAFILINSRGKYPNEIGPNIYSTHLKLLIVDLSKNDIAFYGKSKHSETKNGGYHMSIIKNLNYIYKQISKQNKKVTNK